MPILYENPDRLLRDAKAIKAHLEKTIKPPLLVSNAKVQNALAQFFDWSSWSAMNASSNKDHGYVSWHQLRWKAKEQQFRTRFRNFVDTLSAGHDKLSRTQENDLEARIRRVLVPDISIPERLDGFERLKALMKPGRTFYSALPEHRKREGIEVVASSMSKLLHHLEGNFFGSAYRPGCFVICSAFDVRSFEEFYLKMGYDVTFVGDTFGYKPTTHAKNANYLLEPVFNVPPEDPTSVESYFRHLFELKCSGGLEFLKEQLWRCIQIHCELFRQWPQYMLPTDHCLKSLPELIGFAKENPGSKAASLIKEYVGYYGVPSNPLPDENDEICNKEQYVPNLIFNAFQRVHAMMWEHSVLREKETPQRTNNLLKINVRPSDGEVWLHVVGESPEYDSVVPTIALYRMLVEQWGGFEEQWRKHRADSTVWVLSPNDSVFLNLTHDEKHDEGHRFVFAPHNKARISSLIYGCTSTFLNCSDVLTRVDATGTDCLLEDRIDRINV